MSSLSELDYQRPTPITASEGFQALLADIRERARREEFDRQKFISQDVIERFKELGVYRALVPTRFGGDQRSPMEFCQMVEEISAADGSAGWVASFGMNPVYLAALPLATLEKVYANGPDVVFAGGIFPPQPAAGRRRPAAHDRRSSCHATWSARSPCTTSIASPKATTGPA